MANETRKPVKKPVRKDFDEVVKEKKKNKRKSVALSVVLCLIIAVVGVCYCFNELFLYKQVEVKNKFAEQECPYTTEELEKGLELEKGIGLYSIDNEELQSKIKYNLPYIKSAKIKRKLPDTIVLEAEYENASYYMEIGRNLYILSDELKVLENTDDIEKIEINSLILLSVPEGGMCIEGEKLGIDAETEQVLDILREELEKNEIFNNVIGIDLTNKFDINILCTAKYSVKLGDRSNLETKIAFLKKVLESKKNSPKGGSIDISDQSAREAVFEEF